MLEHLFSPGMLGGMEVKNRIVMPPMGTEYAEPGGYASEALREYYAERARGGTGLVVVEVACVAPRGRIFNCQVAIYDDEFLPGLASLAQAIKAAGAKAAIQLHHAGMATSPRVTGGPPLGPSPIAMRGYEPAEEMTPAGIREVEQAFARAALRAKQAGFDGVEVHGAHLYLIAQFLSPAWNRRQDSYGGSQENRSRLLVETLWAIREVVGRDYPVWVRINAREYGVENGITPQQAIVSARLAEEAGADAISVSCFGWGRYATINFPDSPGAMLPLAEAVKRAVRVPVIAVGRLDPKVGEVALKEGKADFIAIGRALITDPHLPRKAAEGRLRDVSPCISCMECPRLGGRGQGLRCSVNAAVGHETTWAIKPAETPRRVVVVGGGPAGMEAARVAALRGHRVTLLEREHRLGGLLALAGKPRHDNRFPLLERFLEYQLDKLGVKVETGREATLEAVARLQPDAVVVATGASTVVPDIPGKGKKPVVTAEEVLRQGGAQVGQRVVVLGGEKVALRTAQFLAEHGKKVSLVNLGQHLGETYTSILRRPLLDYLGDLKVEFVTGVESEEITEEGLVVQVGGQRRLLEADTIVAATGSEPRVDLAAALEGKVPRVIRVGDCAGSRGLRHAVADGYRAGLEV